MSVLSMDIGGSKILLGKFHHGKILQRHQEATEAHLGREHLLKKILSMIDSMKEDVTALTLLIPGVVYHNSYVHSCGNLPLAHMELKDYIEEKTGIPTVIGNDVSLALYGQWKTSYSHKKHVVGLFAGSGLGGGLILDGKLYTGQGAAGEIGHMNFIPGGRPCSCGGRGCYEAYAAKSGMMTRMEEYRLEGKDSLLFNKTKLGEILDSRDLALGISQGDPLSMELMEASASALGHALSVLHVLLEPDIFLLGGGLIHDLGKGFVEKIHTEACSNIMPAMLERFHLSQGSLGGDAGIYGGYYFALEGKHDAQ